jgi:hypothetical protein
MNTDGNPKRVIKKGKAEEIPSCPSWMQMFTKLTGAIFKKVDVAKSKPRRQHKKGHRMCNGWCGLQHPVDELIGKDNYLLCANCHKDDRRRK